MHMRSHPDEQMNHRAVHKVTAGKYRIHEDVSWGEKDGKRIR